MRCRFSRACEELLALPSAPEWCKELVLAAPQAAGLEPEERAVLQHLALVWPFRKVCTVRRAWEEGAVVSVVPELVTLYTRVGARLTATRLAGTYAGATAAGAAICQLVCLWDGHGCSSPAATSSALWHCMHDLHN